MTARLGRGGAAIMLAMLAMVPAHAQTVPGAGIAARESERVQREQEQRRQDQVNRDRQSARPPVRIEAPPPRIPNGASGTACRDIRVVTLDGIRRLGRGEQAAIVARYQGRCLTAADIERLLGDVTKAYIDRGYATVRAYLPEQDLSTGTLRIVVVEGKVSRVEVRGKPGSVNLAGAFPGVLGRPVNLRMIEQGIDQINRLISNSAKVDLEPGAADGDTVLIVNNVPTRRLRGNFALDNLGSRSTGRVQAALTVSLEDVLGLNELLSVTRRQSSPFNDEARGRSSSESYFASVPFGPLTLSGGLSDSRYRSRIVTPSGTELTLTGTSDNGFATLDWVAVRGRTGQLGMTLGLTRKDNDSFINGQRLDVSSRSLSVLDFDVRAQTSRFGGFATASIGWSHGLRIFGALDDLPGLDRNAPRAQYDKVRASAAYYTGTTIGSQRIDLSSTLAGQYAFDTLYGSEQFAIGGVYSVRGFRETSLINDNGFFWRNEVGFPHTIGVLWGAPMVLKPYLGADVGRVWGHTRDTFSGTLAGGAAGGSLSIGRTFFDVFAAKRFAAPAVLSDEGVTVFARMSVRI